MTWFILLMMIVLGMLLLIIEILIVPGFIVGLIGFSMVVFGIYESYHQYGAFYGNLTLLSTLCLSIFLLLIIIRSKTWNRLKLKTQHQGRVNEIDANKIQVGNMGRTVSRLAPAGKAEFDGEFFEVRTYGDFIDQNQTIEIIKIADNKIFVKLIP